MPWTKRILPHGPLVPLTKNLWQVTGSLPRMVLPRNMLVFRLDDGRLWIHSAIALDEATMRELERLGTPAFLVVPNALHTMDAAAYKRRYPNLRVLCPEPLIAKLASKVAVDGSVDAELPPLGIEVLVPKGFKAVEYAYRLPVPGGAVAFCDLVFNVPHQKGFGGRILRWLGSTGYFGTTKIGRRFFVADAAVLATWMEAVAATNPAIIAMAHGDPVKNGGELALREAAKRLRDGRPSTTLG